MRNEIAARRRYGVNRLRKQFRSYRFLAGDFAEIPLHGEIKCYRGRRTFSILGEKYIGNDEGPSGTQAPCKIVEKRSCALVTHKTADVTANNEIVHEGWKREGFHICLDPRVPISQSYTGYLLPSLFGAPR